MTDITSSNNLAASISTAYRRQQRRGGFVGLNQGSLAAIVGPSASLTDGRWTVYWRITDAQNSTRLN